MKDLFTAPPPWAHMYPDNLDWDLDAVAKPVQDLLDDAANTKPDGICLDFLDRTYTFGEIQYLADRTARGLQQLGIEKGDRVGLCLPNSPYYIAAYFGALKAGATVVNFNPLYTEDEIREQVIDSGVAVMFTLGLKQLYPKVAACLKGTSLRNIIICSLSEALPPVKGLLFQTFKRSEIAETPRNLQNLPFDWLTRNKGNYDAVKIDPMEDVALFQYTGGTTGTPKGAMLTHANISTNTEQVQSWLIDKDVDDESILAVLPFFHVFAMTVILCTALRLRAKIIALPRFDLDQVLKTIDAKKPTLFPAVPTIYNAISTHPLIERYDLTSIRYCISGGAPLPRETKNAFEKLTGCTLVEGYGLTESSPVVSCNPIWADNKEASIGIPLPGTSIEIRDLNNPAHPVALGEKGEMVVRGPQVMKGYWNREDETLDVLEGNWLRTGDVGHMDEDGYVFLTDRIKDVIISGGYKVYPRVIEDAFYKHPDVLEVVVIGIPHGYRGEVPKAFVKLKDGASIDEGHLLAFAMSHLSPIERPDQIEFRGELPKTMIGKLSKKELIEEEAQKRQAQEPVRERGHG